MALTPGTKLGPYEIQSPLGAGGMGEVYKARDTRLDRTVAVKILPSHLSENPEAKQRFDGEARTISSFNHTNICTRHDVGEQDGVDYLVMEYLEGETLADRLRKGPLPVDQVLKYGIEICEGLEGASQRRCSPRSKTRQHHADQDGGQADGLWAGEGVAGGPRGYFGAHGNSDHAARQPSADRTGHGGGNVSIYVARASRG